jgi:DNA-directed RNA polymerase specialized sigma24 family protein
LDDRRAQVVELRFFGGLRVEETAQALNVSAQTVMRDWKVAKAWLMRELERCKEPDGSGVLWFLGLTQSQQHDVR